MELPYFNNSNNKNYILPSWGTKSNNDYKSQSNKYNWNNYTSNNYESNFSVFSFQDAIPCIGNQEFYFKQICCNERKILLNILKYNDIIDVYNIKSTCKIIKKSINKKLIKEYIKKGCLTENTRNKFWKNNLSFETIQEKILRQMNIDEEDLSNIIPLNEKKLFEIILKKAKEELNEKKSEYLFTIKEEISKDINRTFHFGIFKTLEGQTQLGEVLLCLAYIRPEINYCQGMNFIAGALIHYFGRESAFWFFLIFLDDYELSDLFCKVFYINIIYFFSKNKLFVLIISLKNNI